MNVVSMKAKLVAPCGMNCALCLGFQREKNRCPGCKEDDPAKPKYCVTCQIKNCSETAASGSKFCFRCPRYPCQRLKRLDKRYRTRYGMSMIENLNFIRENGIRKFLDLEKKRRKCPCCGNYICVHREKCLYCGTINKKADVTHK